MEKAEPSLKHSAFGNRHLGFNVRQSAFIKTMRWPTYFILAYVAVALQIGLAPYLAYHGAKPDLVLLAVIFIAMNAPRNAALLGCFFLGFVQDLITQQQPGLFAFSYGLVALFVVATQAVVYKGHPLTHFTLALVGGLITAAVLLSHSFVHPPTPRVKTGDLILPAVRLSSTRMLEGVLYTAVLSPFVLALLQRGRKLFGFQSIRRKGRSF
jgi:rod shape-determining protein MreD